eukprot:scaffold516_cov401-Prasinococcus_capsulatus_cf.AAC.1
MVMQAAGDVHCAWPGTRTRPCSAAHLGDSRRTTRPRPLRQVVPRRLYLKLASLAAARNSGHAWLRLVEWCPRAGFSERDVAAEEASAGHYVL